MVDGLRLAGAITKKIEGKNINFACPPTTTTASEYWRTAMDFMGENPHHSDKSARMVVLMALTKKWPCR